MGHQDEAFQQLEGLDDQKTLVYWFSELTRDLSDVEKPGSNSKATSARLVHPRLRATSKETE